jgi:hypothetical protein
VLHQVDVVRAALRDAGLGEVPVRGVLCFIEADWPIIGGAFVTKDVAVVWPQRLAAQLVADGPLGADTIRASQRVLAEALPPA